MSAARRLSLALLLASAAILGGALLFQYVGGLAPCPLCLYQRWPYGIVIALGLVGLVAGGPRSAPWIGALAGGVFVAGALIAVYHVAVEQGWVAGPTACSGPAASADTIEGLKAELLGRRPVRCDEVPWALFGISLAGWNLLVSVALAVFSFMAARRLLPRRA